MRRWLEAPKSSRGCGAILQDGVSGGGMGSKASVIDAGHIYEVDPGTSVFSNRLSWHELRSADGSAELCILRRLKI